MDNLACFWGDPNSSAKLLNSALRYGAHFSFGFQKIWNLTIILL